MNFNPGYDLPWVKRKEFVPDEAYETSLLKMYGENSSFVINAVSDAHKSAANSSLRFGDRIRP